MTVQRIVPGFVIQDYDEVTGKCIEQHFVMSEDENWEDNETNPGDIIDKPDNVKIFPCDMKQP